MDEEASKRPSPVEIQEGVITITAEPREPVESLIGRAMKARHEASPETKVFLSEERFGLVVPVLEEDGIAQIVNRLNEAYTAAVERGDIEEPSPQQPTVPEGVPSAEDDDLSWAELHPILKNVVVASIKFERERHTLRRAQASAQQVAFMSSVADLMQASPFAGSGALQGMAAGFDSISASDSAVRRAFDLAIEKLENG